MMSWSSQTSLIKYPHGWRLSGQGGIFAEPRDSAQFIFTRQYNPTRPERFSPFLRQSYGGSKLSIDFEQLVEDVSLENRMNAISERLALLSPEAESFLRSDSEITSDLTQILECLEEFLEPIDILYSLHCDFWQDSEAPFYEVLEAIVKVDITDYSKILELWKAVDERISEVLPHAIRERIILLFEGL